MLNLVRPFVQEINARTSILKCQKRFQQWLQSYTEVTVNPILVRVISALFWQSCVTPINSPCVTYSLDKLFQKSENAIFFTSFVCH